MHVREIVRKVIRSPLNAMPVSIIINTAKSESPPLPRNGENIRMNCETIVFSGKISFVNGKEELLEVGYQLNYFT